MLGETDCLQEVVASIRLGEVKEALKIATSVVVTRVSKDLPIYSVILKKAMPDRRALTRAALKEIAVRIEELAKSL